MSERHQDMCLGCEEEVWRHNVPLKAEHKRENRTGKESSVVGNAAKMREALDSIYNKLETLDVEEDSYADEVIASVKSDIVDALTAPPRNCDVGTAEEQIKRHRKWCKRDKCLPGIPCSVCFAKWSQLMYEEEGAK